MIEKGEPPCLRGGHFGNVGQRRIKQDTISLNLNLQLRIDNFHSAQCFNRVSAEPRPSLRCLSIASPETQLERCPRNAQRPLQIADAPGRPGIQIER